ncbi:XkdF-like putative serine protease domain-containing protein [Methanobrevibacter arboriphilus]|uniref:XkdF-like putative serine protease domain-containing protein n=1 Tax=Methanobrevibacter arboriphilus TaxID=39441 RepID=UPI0009E6773F|nr:XkdF-like putative serine protease domain-containing protein [Methanobrevibacter arboriphilus]
MYDKQDALYVKYPLMINGITDRQGDVVTGGVTDVKKIFTNSDEILFDEEHERIPIDGITIQESYISKYDEIISGTLVPSGSWIVILRIDNPEIQTKILPLELGGTGEYKGLSLWNDIKNPVQWD